MDWPAIIPDLNLIVHVLGYVESTYSETFKNTTNSPGGLGMYTPRKFSKNHKKHAK